MAEIFWLGGSPCAGKSTISHIIAQEFDWHIYHIDRHFETYLERADAKKHPHLIAYKKMGLRDFLLQDPQTQLKQVMGISREQFSFIVDDLAKLPGDMPILVEGANMLAEDVAKQIKSSAQAIWMIPTETFQLEAYPKRGSWVQDVLRHNYDADDGILAFERWMERDAQMAKWTALEAEKYGVPVIVVDGSISLSNNAEIVMQGFGLIDK